jgi:uncharacterized protein (DUF4415 family)
MSREKTSFDSYLCDSPQNKKGGFMPNGKTKIPSRNAAIPYEAESDLYDPNDSKAVNAFWRTATIKRGRGRPILDVKRPTLNMRIDADVLQAFKATGPGWQTRINAVLVEAVRKGL